jgi:hypothetical protein
MKIQKVFVPLCLVVCLTSCVIKNESAQSAEINEQKTKEVLDHHWKAFQENDLEGTMEDYTEESVLITPDATYKGLDQIRENFVNAFKAFPSDSSTLTLTKSVVVKDVGYILWNAKTPVFNLSYATDSFIIQDGKIVRQTYAGVAE